MCVKNCNANNARMGKIVQMFEDTSNCSKNADIEWLTIWLAKTHTHTRTFNCMATNENRMWRWIGIKNDRTIFNNKTQPKTSNCIETIANWPIRSRYSLTWACEIGFYVLRIVLVNQLWFSLWSVNRWTGSFFWCFVSLNEIKWQLYVLIRNVCACIVCLLSFCLSCWWFFSRSLSIWHFQFKKRSITANDSIISCQFMKIGQWKDGSEQRMWKGDKKTKIDSIISFFLSLSLILLWNLNIELKFSTRKSCNEYFKWQWVGSMAMHIEFQHTTRCTVANHLENQSNEKKGFELSAEFLMDSLVDDFHFPKKKIILFSFIKGQKQRERVLCRIDSFRPKTKSKEGINEHNKLLTVSWKLIV